MWSKLSSMHTYGVSTQLRENKRVSGGGERAERTEYQLRTTSYSPQAYKLIRERPREVLKNVICEYHPTILLLMDRS